MGAGDAIHASRVLQSSSSMQQAQDYPSSARSYAKGSVVACELAETSLSDACLKESAKAASSFEV